MKREKEVQQLLTALENFADQICRDLNDAEETIENQAQEIEDLKEQISKNNK